MVAPMSVLGDRLKQARKAAGLSQTDLAKIVGVTPQAIQAIEGGRVRTTRQLNEIAAAVKRPPEWLSGNEGTRLAPSLIVNHAIVKGFVAAGLWQEDDRITGDETPVPSVPDPRYARLPQIAFRVIGTSMNRKVVDGEYVICLDYSSTPMALRDGDVVVAERCRAGEIERTVKRVRMSRGVVELWPDSDDPGHQKPLKLTSREEDTEVRVAGIVIGYYRPA